jgi:hypothetical protein
MIPEHKNFMVLGLPRSRTQWLANFLSTDNTFCYHELIGNCGSILEVKEKLRLPFKYTGLADTCGYLVHEQFSCPKIVIHRDIEEVKLSIRALYNTEQDFSSILLQAEKELNNIHGLHIEYESIDSELKKIWEYLFDLPFNKHRAELLSSMNIQTKELYPTKEGAFFINSLLRS